VEKAAASKANVTEVIGDVAYDSREIFSYLDRKGIEPIIKVRKNASVHAFGCMPRKLVALEQLRDYERWKKRHGYGRRARVESAISSFKRTFGEHISSVKWENMTRELLVKASVYNMFMSLNP
jgi:transposase